MMIRLLLPLATGLLFGSLANAAPIRLVTGDEYAPFAGQNLPNGGMLTELVQQVLSRAGHQTSLTWLPWKRGYQATLKGQFDATYPYLPTPERQAEYLFSAKLYETTQRLFSRAGHALEPDDLQQLEGKRMCLPLGWQPPPRLAPLLAVGKLQRHEPQDLTTCARLIDLGRDDFFVADSLLGERAIHRSGLAAERFSESQGVVGSNTLHFLVPRSRPGAQQLIDEFDKSLRLLQENGEYARILRAHRQHALSAE
ncbi:MULTISPECIES: transporter substrate-binding domain-containing protein [unclassified Pseudomonas]|uniref:substrate-binding periplasmic protein n=1 Tax=unclassified Pseudomonas TaxID=196821 RepID=UPI00244C62C0|nr:MULTISPECIES: transporter substrate-binding domain-containing protein [unclassified Pseudomonas]MDG9925239.1 transporter substrate-binding domain-containing protein [Pseudomonas sp. GD04045]MDH0036106.1 transporter substrate-binding domain-containing protein [Pseudomonas sp. GD04019]